MKSHLLLEVTRKITAMPIFGKLLQNFFGQSALAVIQSGITWHLIQGSVAFGKKEIEIKWLELDRMKAAEKELLALYPILTILEESECVMGHCKIAPCRRHQWRFSLGQQINKWMPFQCEPKTFAHTIWRKAAKAWQVGLFATTTSSLTQQLRNQAVAGYQADRCLPESLALLAYHLERNPHLNSALVIHVRSQSALFMIIGQNEILAQQTVKGDLWNLKNASDRAKQQARQIALSLQMSYQKLYPDAPLDQHQWLLTGLRDEELWLSLNISLAPLEKSAEGDLAHDAEFAPLIQGLFAIQFRSKWPETNFLSPLQRSLSPPRLWLAVRPIVALTTVLTTLCLSSNFAKAKSLEMKTRKDFGQLAHLVNHQIAQGRGSLTPSSFAAAIENPGLEQNCLPSLARHLKRWRAQILQRAQKLDFKVLNALLPLLAKSAKPFLSQGLRVEQLSVQRASKNRGQMADLQLQLICCAEKGELLGDFLNQLQMQLPQNASLIKRVHRGNRAVVQMNVTTSVLPDRPPLHSEDAL